MTKPAVDVLLPVREPAPWVGDALAGLALQDYTRWRAILIMDGYSARVHDLARSACPNLLVLTARDSPGLVALLNLGLSKSTAPYVARLDADDVPAPARFSKQVAYLERHPECSALGTSCAVIDTRDRIVGFRRPSGGSGSVLRRLRWRNAIVHPSVMMRRVAALSQGGYRPSARHGEDYDLWLRMAAVSQVHVLDEVLLDYRVHSAQVTQTAQVSRETKLAILESRLNLAVAKGESRLAARLRHFVWSCRY